MAYGTQQWHVDEMPEEAFKPETADYLRRFEKQFPQNDMNLDQLYLKGEDLEDCGQLS